MGIIRLLLALFVIVAHSENFFGFSFLGGQTAVELFFIISGFYMTMVLNEKYVGKGSYLPFIQNRFLKIYPIYWSILFLTLIAFLILLLYFHNDEGFRFYVDHYRFLDATTLLFIVFTNLFIFAQDIIMFLGVDSSGTLILSDNFAETNPKLYQSLFVPQAWTLALELTFYVIAPFIVRRKIWIISLLICISLFVRFFMYYELGFTNDPWTHRFFISELSLFLFGTLAYRLAEVLIIKNKLILYTIFVFTLIHLVFYEYIYDDLSLLNNWYLYISFSLSVAYVFQLFKDSKIDSFIGEFSYPIYLSHVAIIGAMNALLRKFELLEYLSELTFLVSILFSFLLISIIVRPVEKVRKRNILELKNA